MELIIWLDLQIKGYQTLLDWQLCAMARTPIPGYQFISWARCLLSELFVLAVMVADGMFNRTQTIFLWLIDIQDGLSVEDIRCCRPGTFLVI